MKTGRLERVGLPLLMERLLLLQGRYRYLLSGLLTRSLDKLAGSRLVRTDSCNLLMRSLASCYLRKCLVVLKCRLDNVQLRRNRHLL